MKKTLVALAVLASAGTAFAAGHAAAPASSVTLFGILDAGVTHIDKTANGKSFSGLTSSNVASSQFGMRGSENIGGGLRAIFELTADVDTNNGTFDDNRHRQLTQELQLTGTAGKLDWAAGVFYYDAHDTNRGFDFLLPGVI